MKDNTSKPTKPQRSKPSGEIPATFKPRFWQDADRRVSDVRRIEALVERLKLDAGADSRQREILVERVAFLAIILETRERDAMDGKAFDSGSYTQSVNALVGCLRMLGLEKRAKKLGLADYVASGKGGAP